MVKQEDKAFIQWLCHLMNKGEYEEKRWWCFGRKGMADFRQILVKYIFKLLVITLDELNSDCYYCSIDTIF